MINVNQASFGLVVKSLGGVIPPLQNPGSREIIFVDRRSSCGEDRLDGSGAFKRAVCWGKA